MVAPTAHLSYSVLMEQDTGKFRIIVRNRKARHNYHISTTIEAGIELKGTEIKSLRNGKVQMADAYAIIENGQVYLKSLHISPYLYAGATSHEPTRTRRLLLHKREIRKLEVKTQQQGMTLIPLSIYFKGKLAKVELALAIGRKKYDKRQAIAKAEADRRIKQATRKDMDR